MPLRPLSLAARLALVGAFASAGACSSDAPDAPLDDPPVDAGGVAPSGVAYPTDGLGYQARRRGARGDRIPNFAFRGYPDGAPGELVPLELSRYYDPEARDHRVLVVQIVAVWCAICASEVRQTLGARAELEAEGARFLRVVVNGATPGEGPSKDELDRWVRRFDGTYATVVDVGARRMGVFGLSGVPWNVAIDTRTMEILGSNVGEPPDFPGYVRAALELAAGPPAY